ncbi:MAG: phosphonate ABC transporter, permease protein PhnE [Aggregatilineales bacterium]|nr:phosphonate ABC transporter, permease protein PhnE [Aggregatilineales bacterium]HPV07228.1 phosphonate ABC transporter, permease protein PhnE [Aggregatilineales bacterium]HQE18514.1 phosphonate ABC transporter, permease protein PhnE [Aggregatilineales bacterium]
MNRNPVIATVLSLIIPGLGQAYARQRGRGLLIFSIALVLVGLFVWAVLGSLVRLREWMQIFLGVNVIVYWLWNVYDAWRTAHGNPLPLAQMIVIASVFSYVLGWRVTQIDTNKFLTEFPRTFRILTRVVWPWEAAFEREEEVVQASAQFAIPCGEDSEIPALAEPSGDDEPWLIVDPTCGVASNFTTQGFQPGTEIVLRGGGFAPNEFTEIWWEDPLGHQFRPTFSGNRISATTDENGEFELTFYVPQMTIPSTAVGIQMTKVHARQIAEVGRLQPTANLRMAFSRMIETIFLALMATTFGIVLAIPISFLAARNLMSASPITLSIYYVVRAILNVFRSIEPLIWAMIGVAWVGLGPFAGVIALTVHSIAALGKLYSEAIESIDTGPIEAIQATGATWMQTIIYAVIPQIIPPFLSFTIYRWDINVRMSTIIGAVGGGGIGFLLFQWIRLTDWSNAGIAVWMIAITVMIMDYASAELRERLI